MTFLLMGLFEWNLVIKSCPIVSKKPVHPLEGIKFGVRNPAISIRVYPEG